MDQLNEIKAHHISLYMALFRQWNRNRFENPVSISRKETMAMAKIGSPNTYTQALKKLHSLGLIRYHPSYDPTKGSRVDLYRFDTGTCTLPVSKVIPSINIKTIHTIREPNFYDNQKPEEMNTEEQKRTINELNNNHNPQQDLFDFEEMPLPEEIIPQKEKRTRFVSPPLKHIQIYFQEKNHSKTEAERFFNYYESNGWLVGGKTKMKDWKAAARNWMLNIQKFETKSTIPERNALSLSKRSQNNKPKPPGHKPSTNYSEPL